MCNARAHAAPYTTAPERHLGQKAHGDFTICTQQMFERNGKYEMRCIRLHCVCVVTPAIATAARRRSHIANGCFEFELRIYVFKYT